MDEAWRMGWRIGFAPQMTDAELLAGLEGLRSGDPRMIQGETTDPPPRGDAAECPCKAACFIGYCAWKAGADTVGKVESRFAVLCMGADHRLHEAAGCRHFLNWFDETPIEDVRRELAIEVGKSLLERGVAA